MPPSSKNDIVAVDIGNQQIKLGRLSCDSDQISHPKNILRFPTDEPDLGALNSWLSREPVVWRVATVHRMAEQRLAAWVEANRPGDVYRRIQNRDIPIKTRVEYPHRVGTDRLLAAVAANRMRRPDRAAIVIDAGSAITVDLVSADGAFEGGVILPGLRIVGRALESQTDALPMVYSSLEDAPPPVVGKSTQAAIRSGLFWGSVGAVREIVRRMAGQLTPSPEVFLAGGDAEHFAPFLDFRLAVSQDLVFAGIAIVHQSLAAGPSIA